MTKSPNFAELGFVKAAALSTEISIGDPQHNADRLLAATRKAVDTGASIVVCGELCITGYSAEDLFFTDTLLATSKAALAHIAKHNCAPLLVVGCPWRLADGRLLNCAAVFGGSRLLGLVPKSVHPNYAEFYDLRWFAPGGEINETIIDAELGQFQVRVDQLFALDSHLVGVEICEDLWAPIAPSTNACLAGAHIMLNLSASNELIAKPEYRRELVRMTSAKNVCGYLYASAGASESSKDIVFGGHCMAAENGQLLGESERFNLRDDGITVTFDTARLQNDRSQNISFTQVPRPRPYRIVPTQQSVLALQDLDRKFAKHPFVPSDESEFAARAQQILKIQATGLARRMLAAHTRQLVIGLSGGLDSTLAYLVCLDALQITTQHDDATGDAAKLHAITMPGPGTSKLTHGNAARLCDAASIELVEIPIDAAVAQHLNDLDHEGDHDIVFENAQARERTQILFNYANKVGGIVVGTGDLSELALGWCTFNADHMASYNVNASVPKTMMAYLVRWYAQHRADKEMADVLEDVLATPISPELIPPSDGEITQRTEDVVGPYELHDFFLFHFLRNGAGATKMFHLARLAFAGDYDDGQIKHWLGQFLRRFFSQQFKRTTLPPGPKVGSVSLSPRGDWRMPDEASAEQMLAELDKISVGA